MKPIFYCTEHDSNRLGNGAHIMVEFNNENHCLACMTTVSDPFIPEKYPVLDQRLVPSYLSKSETDYLDSLNIRLSYVTLEKVNISLP